MHHQEIDLYLGRARLAKANNEESFQKLLSKQKLDENESKNERWK